MCSEEHRVFVFLQQRSSQTEPNLTQSRSSLNIWQHALHLHLTTLHLRTLFWLVRPGYWLVCPWTIVYTAWKVTVLYILISLTTHTRVLCCHQHQFISHGNSHTGTVLPSAPIYQPPGQLTNILLPFISEEFLIGRSKLPFMAKIRIIHQTVYFYVAARRSSHENIKLRQILN